MRCIAPVSASVSVKCEPTHSAARKLQTALADALVAVAVAVVVACLRLTETVVTLCALSSLLSSCSSPRARAHRLVSHSRVIFVSLHMRAKRSVIRFVLLSPSLQRLHPTLTSVALDTSRGLSFARRRMHTSGSFCCPCVRLACLAEFRGHCRLITIVVIGSRAHAHR